MCRKAKAPGREGVNCSPGKKARIFHSQNADFPITSAAPWPERLETLWCTVEKTMRDTMQ